MKTVALAVGAALTIAVGLRTGSASQSEAAGNSLPTLAAAPARADTTPRTAVSRLALQRHEPSFLPVRRVEPTVSLEALSGVVEQYCGKCHNERRKSGNLVLTGFDVADAAHQAETAEKMIRKLQAGMMPPPGVARPEGDTLAVLMQTLEGLIDEAAGPVPEPGHRTFQRLNRAEYSAAVAQLLDLEIDAGSWLPLDTKSANFDNIADVQMPSATLLDAYLDAASEISRLAVGDPNSAPNSTTYKLPRLASQWDHVDGAPVGTRGGVSVTHNFPADGEYVFTISLHAIPTGQLFGSTAPFDERLEISVDGVRVALLEIDRWMSQADPNGMDIKTDPIPLRAGPQRVSAAFVRTFEGPVNDLLAPIDHSIADTQIGSEHGITNVTHLRDLAIAGPYRPTGVSETPSRKKIFSCRPLTAEETRPCAESIVRRLGTEAYRRPLTAKDLAGLMQFFEDGAREGGFEVGIRTAIEATLASPHFIFRLEEAPATARPGQRYNVAGVDLASRLSFFLWGTPPDARLTRLGSQGRLTDPAVLDAEARRLLADPRSEALATRFAAQWLRLQDIDKVHPDALQFPDFHEQLGTSMRRETELLFDHLIRENRSFSELFTADYTFVDEALAKHYGIPGVTGPEFRKVNYPDARRAGLLGHASVLTLTSHANRTSPVLRGKWVMEVLLGSPPPPPPPGVPDLEETIAAEEGRMLTTRERMELHRAKVTCHSCHQFMDPIGLALDNFDVTGQWRIRENGMPLDTEGEFYDGTTITSPGELRAVLLKRPVPLVRTFTENLLAYALGRRVEYYDGPTVRRIAGRAAKTGFKMQDFVLGVIQSEPFRQQRLTAAADAAAPTP
ncbi:MAG: DUF1592 domain-containing protein [Gemmatimonadales bacterium]